MVAALLSQKLKIQASPVLSLKARARKNGLIPPQSGPVKKELVERV